MGLRCIKIYLNDEIPEEKAILDAWDSCQAKRRSALGRAWLLGEQPRLSKAPPPTVNRPKLQIVERETGQSEQNATAQELAEQRILDQFGQFG